MNIQLMKLRKAAGYSNRDDFADKIGVNKYTYRSWESGAAMMNAEQVWNCAVALGCTPNDGFNVNESYNSYDSKSAGQEFREFSEFISISIYRDYSGKNSGKPLITSLQCPHSDI